MSDFLERFDEQIHTIPQALYNSAASFGGRPANLFKEDKWQIVTYSELVNKVENIALGLIKLGLQAGDLVGIKAHTSARWTWADLGSNFAGCASVSLYPTLSKKETLYIAEHSEMKLLFVGDYKVLIDTLAYLDEMPNIKYVVCLEKGFKGNGTNILGLGEVMHMGNMAREELTEEMKKRQDNLTEHSPATMVYTSGTTGAQKGAMLTHRMVLHAAYRGYTHLHNHGHSQNYNIMALAVLPLSHIMEKVNSYYGPLCLGGCIGFSTPATMLADIQVIRPTWVMWVPRLLSRVYLGFQQAFSATEVGKAAWEWAMDVAVRASYELEDEHGRIDTTIPYPEQLTGQLREEWINADNNVYWRIRHAFGGRVWDLNLGGAYVDPDLHRKFLGMGFCVTVGYGLTESGSGVVHAAADAAKVGYVGLVDPDTELKLAEDGEILMRARGVITEYYKNEAANRESFTEDGWFKTGDIGEFDEVGNLRIIDRKKTLIILDTGKNVASARIEGLCSMSGLIDQIAVLGQDRKFISALIVPNFDVLLNVMSSRGVPYDESKIKYGEMSGMTTCIEVGREIVESEAVIKAVQNEVDKVNAQLEDYEQIKAFRLLNKKFTEDSGELTPSQKVKMKVVNERYADIIDDIYK